MKHTSRHRRASGRRSWRTLVAAVALLGVSGIATRAAAATPASSLSAAAEATAGRGAVTVEHHAGPSPVHAMGIRW